MTHIRSAQSQHAPAQRRSLLALGALLAGLTAVSAAQAAGETAEAEQARQVQAMQAAEQARAAEAKQSAEQAREAEAKQSAERMRHEAAQVRSEARQAERAASIAEAERQLAEAARAMEEARQGLAESRTENMQDQSRMREELSRAHRALRDASREVARAHRELAMAERERSARIRAFNLGDRAVIGVLLGPADDNGIQLIGVSPDGPAERAGLRAGDVLVMLNGIELAANSDGDARDTLLSLMEDVGDGQELPVEVLRDDERLNFSVTAEQREPASWQSLVRLHAPSAPIAPSATADPTSPPLPDEAPHVVVERIEIPELDYEKLERKLERIDEQLQRFEYRFIGEDGETIEFSQDFSFDGDEFSAMGRHALEEANLMFGLPHTHGLEMVALNPKLGAYFKAERGVLIVRADTDNVYGLESGDVIVSVDGEAVERPADVLRALRDTQPGNEVELAIKRDRRSRTLTATVPENRFGGLHLNALPTRLGNAPANVTD
ncbi:PDZ domain-containing protein [Elongatibacter sediminis]|uniref:PDZ domain-containing protein n=1 Tax=Elongatibacter sediminis TaxID=3119006 RepID=A0AAW9RHA8_9GAMM